MNYLEELLSYHSPKRFPKEIYPTRVSSLLQKLDIDIHSPKYIHITGSKGKGSLAFTSFAYLSQKSKVGLFTSPHIIDMRERFIINGKMISEERLNNLVLKYKTFFKDLHFFEICLLLALIYFIEEGCEYIVLEVGVGGRFDPTNFCKPILILLGHISIEHRDFLGDTLEQIAYDKAGIIKKNTPTFSVNQDLRAVPILQNEGDIYFYDDVIKISNHTLKPTLQIFDLTITLPHKQITIPNIQLHRLGRASLINFSLAIAGIFAIEDNFNIEYVHNTAKTRVPYRMDIISEKLMIDTAHNGASFDNLLNTLEDIKWNPVVLYLTILEGKELQDISRVLINHKNIIHHIEFFEFKTSSTRKSDVAKLYEIIKDNIPSTYHEDISTIQLSKEHYKVFSGSFYSIPQILGAFVPESYDTN